MVGIICVLSTMCYVLRKLRDFTETEKLMIVYFLEFKLESQKDIKNVSLWYQTQLILEF